MTRQFTNDEEILRFAVFDEESVLKIIKKQSVRIGKGYTKKEIIWDFTFKNGRDWHVAFDIERVMSDKSLAAAKKYIAVHLNRVFNESV